MRWCLSNSYCFCFIFIFLPPLLFFFFTWFTFPAWSVVICYLTASLLIKPFLSCCWCVFQWPRFASTYYCINLRHNSALIHVYLQLERLKDKRTGALTWCICTNKNIISHVLICSSYLCLLVHFSCNCIFGVYICKSFLNIFFLRQTFNIYCGMLAVFLNCYSLFFFVKNCVIISMHAFLKFTKVAERCKEHSLGIFVFWDFFWPLNTFSDAKLSRARILYPSFLKMRLYFV